MTLALLRDDQNLHILHRYLKHVSLLRKIQVNSLGPHFLEKFNTYLKIP